MGRKNWQNIGRQNWAEKLGGKIEQKRWEKNEAKKLGELENTLLIQIFHELLNIIE